MFLVGIRKVACLWITLAAATAFAAPSSFVMAQQSFARFDFANAYKHAAAALLQQPGNIEARRIAAKSAREMRNFAECLRIAQEIPLQKMEFEDVGCVGECSVNSTFSQRAQSILVRQMQSSENRDIASYWLGRQSYLREDYRGAEKLLAGIQILPDRLEKDRQKMLERIRDVLLAQTPKAPVATPPPKIAAPAVPPKPLVSSTPEIDSPPKISPVPQPRPAPQASSGKQVDAPDGKVGQYAFLQGSFKLNSEISALRDTVSLEPFSQQEYEKNFDVTQIKNTNSILVDGGGTVSLRAGFGSRKRLEQDAKINFLGVFEFDGSMANRTIWLYQPTSRLKYPLGSVGVLGRGVEFGLVPELQIALGDNFESELGVRAKLNVPDTNRMRTLFDLHGMAAIKSERFRLESQYVYDRYFVGSRAGFAGHNLSLDFRANHLGIFGFGAPPGYALFRYARYVALSGKHIVRFMIMEGDFLEFNVAPRLRVSENVDVFFWYHVVQGSRRQLWSSKDVKSYYGITDVDLDALDYSSYEPTAMYTNLSSEFTLGTQWTKPNGMFLATGVGLRTTSARAQSFEPEDRALRQKNKNLPENYDSLINAGGGKMYRGYASFGFTF